MHNAYKFQTRSTPSPIFVSLGAPTASTQLLGLAVGHGPFRVLEATIANSAAFTKAIEKAASKQPSRRLGSYNDITVEKSAVGSRGRDANDAKRFVGDKRYISLASALSLSENALKAGNWPFPFALTADTFRTLSLFLLSGRKGRKSSKHTDPFNNVGLSLIHF